MLGQVTRLCSMLGVEIVSKKRKTSTSESSECRRFQNARTAATAQRHQRELAPVPDFDETKMDQIASLPHFPENGQGAAARFRAPSASINSTHSHSRASSSASTFDID